MKWIAELLPYFESHKKDVLWWDKDFLLRHIALQQALEAQGFSIVFVKDTLVARTWFELHLKQETVRYLLVSAMPLSLLPDMQEAIHSVEIGYKEFVRYFDSGICKTMDDETIEMLYRLDSQQYKPFTLSQTHKYLSLQHFEKWFEQMQNNEKAFAQAVSDLIIFGKDNAANCTNPDYWSAFAPLIAKVKLLSLALDSPQAQETVNDLETEFNTLFQNFIDTTHAALPTRQHIIQPYSVTGFLDFIHFQNKPKQALLIIDGLNWWQWLILEKALHKQDIAAEIKSSFAWLPSITAWSRQAIFKGGKPDLTQNNSKEQQLFTAYWANKRKAPHDIAYTKLSYKDTIEYPKVNHLSIVINDIDDLLHGSSVMGNIQLFSAVQKWVETGNIIRLIKQLKADSYTIYLSADHGNIGAKGTGNISLQEKTGHVSRSKRHISFDNAILAKNFKQKYPVQNIGQIENSLYLRSTEAFTLTDQTVVTHGGSHFWEIIVPFIII